MSRSSVYGGGSQSSSSNQGLCSYCNQRPRYRAGTTVHSYCGRTCARLAGSGGSTPTSPGSVASLSTALSSLAVAGSPGSRCQTPGCTSPVFVGVSGIPSKYCTGTHKRWGDSGCISCRAAPRNGALVMCQPCHDKALRTAPAIIEVPEDHDSYRSVETQFRHSWRHKTTCPEVRAVYKIIITTASLKKYEQYLDSVEAKHNFSSKGLPRGNENRRWHGTRRKCKLGDKGVKNFCGDSDCSLCRIVKTSLDLKYFKEATGWGRFGEGIYTSSTSSKSNDYSKNGTASKWKALLLNKVVVGKGMKLTQNNSTLTKPPSGYDSVLAEVVPGGSLNYDELVVYNNDAARPSYLVMYESA